MLAGVGGILGLHLSASDREPWPVRVLAAALPPIAACTVYFTLSRGGIFASAFGVAVYLVLGFSRATPGALLAIVPTSAYAFIHAYDADLLVDNDTLRLRRPALAQGRDVCVGARWSACVAAIALRAVALLLDRGVAGAARPRPAARARARGGGRRAS